MSAVKMLSDDLAELSLDRVDKEISTQLKSDEELDRLTVDPHLTGIERAVYLLRWMWNSFGLIGESCCFVNKRKWHCSMDDRSSLVQTPPPTTTTMRGGVLEPIDNENMPLQAVIVKNGKIFIDSIEPPLHDGDDNENDNDIKNNNNDENSRLDEEFDIPDDDDDEEDGENGFVNQSKFSQDAFDSFMRAGDNEDDQLRDIMLIEQLHSDNDSQCHNLHIQNQIIEDENSDSNREVKGISFSDQQAFSNSISSIKRPVSFHEKINPYDDDSSSSCPYDALQRNSSGSSTRDVGTSCTPDVVTPTFDPSLENHYCGPNERLHLDDAHIHYNASSLSSSNGSRSINSFSNMTVRRDSLNLEEYSTFSSDVGSLLSEDFDTSWRYVPLYPENYYSSGQEVQRVSVITDLPNLLRDNNAECMRRVVPKVREVLHVANLEMQLAAASAFLLILERKLVSVDDYRKTFLQTILTSVDNKNEEVASAWLDTLLSVIDLLPKDVVKKDILSIAVNKGQLSQTLQARLSCCKILGKVSSKFENFVVKNEVLPVVSSLCGDVEYDVRACMCQRLDVVAHGLGLELTKGKLLTQLIELSEDENQNVICACMETTANIVEMLDREANTNAIMPMVKDLCEKAFNNVDSTLATSSRLLGRLCHSLSEYMTLDDKAFFQEFYKKLCKVGITEKKNKEDTVKMIDAVDVFDTTPDLSSETRRNAAYNFPAMVLFVGVKLFRLELYPSFSQLCRDPHVIVRRTIAAGFHEVAKLLGSNIGIIFPELNSLLNDADIEVLKAIVPHFKEIMSSLTAVGFEQFTEHRAHVVQDVATAFLRADAIVFDSPCWRTQEAMIQSMECLSCLCNNDFIFTKVLPLLMTKLKTGRALPVKVAAAKALVILSRTLRYKAQREEIVQRLIDDFHDSESCYQRSLFIEMARCYLKVNSKQSFKDNFYEHILNMRSDPVATVRLKMLTVLPEMKRSLKLPKDQALRTALDTVLRQVTVYDKDVDVQIAAHQMSEELPLIQEGSDSTRTNRRNLTKEEEEDLRREDEEKEMLAREDKERKEEEAKLTKGSEKRNSVSSTKKDSTSKIPGAKKSIGGKSLQGSSKADASHPMGMKKTSTVNNPVAGLKGTKCNSPSAAQDNKSIQMLLVKSKSTTCIPSLIPKLEPRPSTPPRKEVRKIPVFVAHKTASSPSLSTNANKKGSPLSTRKQSNTTPLGGGLSAGTAASNNRRGSAGNVTSSTLARRGSIGSANSTGSDSSVKIKPSLSTARQVNAGSRVKKISK